MKINILISKYLLLIENKREREREFNYTGT